MCSILLNGLLNSPLCFLGICCLLPVLPLMLVVP